MEIGPHEQGKRIWVLIIEDEEDHVLLIKAVFEHFEERAHITVANTAEEAIAQFEGPWAGGDRAQADLPDVIVLDIHMPGIGGMGFLEWYKERDLQEVLPVVVFTSVQDPDLADRCFALGAKEFKLKPTDFRELVPLVRRVLEEWTGGG